MKVKVNFSNERPHFLKRLHRLLKAIWKYITYNKYKNNKPVIYFKPSTYLNSEVRLKWENVKDKMTFHQYKHENLRRLDKEYQLAMKKFRASVWREKFYLKKEIKEAYINLFN
ncbi:hypothetical protein [Helcococcus kunzii]|uniref:hypothetical protein n=1 Tax=Helcococcus kunzii TaxID=40091 RepID=UPI0024AD4D60|nr:hypothetical protein [Helcococcus kunzii]